ncbi:Uncharacterised protein [Vibrio cholerae]|nr:Uncharacterised protein [Vibrio cholerae]
MTFTNRCCQIENTRRDVFCGAIATFHHHTFIGV